VDTIEALLTRRSVRHYDGRPVPGETVHLILDGAMHAPSAHDQQPWQFIVIDDRRVLDAIPGIHPWAQMARGAPLAVLVCGDGRLALDPGFWVQDCAAATENLLLAAWAHGVGSVWTGIHPDADRERAFRRLLGIPDHVTPFALVVLGYPSRPPTATVTRFREDRVHHDHW
jgi:nitroreductase